MYKRSAIFRFTYHHGALTYAYKMSLWQHDEPFASARTYIELMRRLVVDA